MKIQLNTYFISYAGAHDRSTTTTAGETTTTACESMGHGLFGTVTVTETSLDFPEHLAAGGDVIL